MGFFDNLKDFKRHLSEVENNIYTNKQDFLEIYEKNVQLEKEISERKKELDVANQRMLSLQHIWEMMNSTKPLSSVLETIVKSLQGELGYLHSCIIQKKDDEQGQYLKIITYAEDTLIKRIDMLLGTKSYNLRLNYDENGVFAQSLREKRIIQSKSLRTMLHNIRPEMSVNMAQDILDNAVSRSVVVIPLKKMQEDFGWLIVFSSRDAAMEQELDFLNMFAKQIELAITIADLFKAVKNQAVTDALTTLYNRRYFEEALQKEVVRAKRMNQPFTLIGLDLDHLKQINDKFGHSYGDVAISTISHVLKKNARAIDVAARIGGEEFNVLLPGVDSKGGMIAAERLRAAIEDCKLEEIGHITASIGVATFLEHTDNVDELMEITDQAMYIAKRNGRNRVQIAEPISEISWQEVAINTFVDILSKHRVPVEQNFAQDLCKKLSIADEKQIAPKETLYSVADMLAKTYNPLHIDGVTKSKVEYATSLAKSFDMSKDEIDKLKIAILLYDIGNLMMPQSLLQKTEPLTEEERSKIKEHPVIAAREILRPISQVQDIIPIIEHHHENWDGSGYPAKITGNEIPVSSQIILIVDAYFALTEPRTYRKALGAKEALDVIKKDSGKKWNDSLVKEFSSIVENDIKSLRIH